jgi:hypothetical protein
MIKPVITATTSADNPNAAGNKRRVRMRLDPSRITMPIKAAPASSAAPDARRRLSDGNMAAREVSDRATRSDTLRFL